MNRARSNNFDLIRLVAALAVVVSHSFPIAQGIGTPEPLTAWTGGSSLGIVAVITFMAMSGYLVTGSAQRSTLGRYARARFLRVYPALLTVVLLLTFVLGPLLTGRVEPAYLLNGSGMYLVEGMSGMFAANPFPQAVNGSLWTLSYELAMYLLVGTAMMTGTLRVGPTVALWLALVLVVALTPENPGFFLPLAFVSGSLVQQARVPLRWWVALAAVGVILLGTAVGAFLVVTTTAGAYLIVWLAHRTHPVHLRWDLSYGTYIWAFPVQQMIAKTWALPWWANVALTLPVVLSLAAASWLLVERPAISLKDWPLRLRHSEPVNRHPVAG